TRRKGSVPGHHPIVKQIQTSRSITALECSLCKGSMQTRVQGGITRFFRLYHLGSLPLPVDRCHMTDKQGPIIFPSGLSLTSTSNSSDKTRDRHSCGHPCRHWGRLS